MSGCIFPDNFLLLSVDAPRHGERGLPVCTNFSKAWQWLREGAPRRCFPGPRHPLTARWVQAVVPGAVPAGNQSTFAVAPGAASDWSHWAVFAPLPTAAQIQSIFACWELEVTHHPCDCHSLLTIDLVEAGVREFLPQVGRLHLTSAIRTRVTRRNSHALSHWTATPAQHVSPRARWGRQLPVCYCHP